MVKRGGADDGKLGLVVICVSIARKGGSCVTKNSISSATYMSS